MPSSGAFCATVFAPITFPPSNVLVFRQCSPEKLQLIAKGIVLDSNPDRIILKRVRLSGHPFKVNKRTAVVRYMFFNREWFKPVELYTHSGRHGRIKQPLGTHGLMKCVFDRPLSVQDSVLMNLYKRVFPKWTYNAETRGKQFCISDEADDTLEEEWSGKKDKKMETMQHARSRAIVLQDFESLLNDLNSRKDKFIGNNYVKCQGGSDNTFDNISFDLSGDKLTDSITTIFSDILISANNLIQTSQELFESISMYDEDNEGSSVLETIVEFLPFLQKLEQFVYTTSELTKNLLLQIHGFLTFGRNEIKNHRADQLPLTRMWRTLGDLLSTFAVLDALILSHPFLREHWAVLLRSVRLVQFNPAQFDLEGLSTGRLQHLNALIERLDLVLMNGKILTNTCIKLTRFDQLSSDRQFMERFRLAIMQMLTNWEKHINSSENAIPDKKRLICLLTLSKLFHHLLPERQKPDKKIISKLLGINKNLISFHLFADLLFIPFDFILKEILGASKVVDKKVSSTIQIAKGCQLNKLLENLYKYVQTVFIWEKKLNRLLKYILNIHLAEQKPISKANVRLIFVLIQFVKTISNTFTSNWNFIIEAINYGCVHLSASILSILQSIIQSNGESKQPFFANSILNSALSLSQPVGRKALIVAGVSLELANYQKTLRGNDVQIDETLKKLDILCNFGHVLSNSTDLSFLYWHRLSLMQAFCEDLIQEQITDFSNEDLPRTITDFFSAINECGRLIISVKHCDQQTFLQTFSNELFLIITNNFLSKLCTEIENDLRLSYHQQQSSSFEQLEKVFSTQNPLQQEEKPLNKLLLNLLQIPKIKLGNRIIVVFDYVTNYLSSTFYNFSVIALHDSEAYNRMRILAKHRYGLNLEDYQLPTRCVDQGLDLITLMSEEKMSKFLEDYCYDLDEQFFIERSSQSKQLAIVRVQQIVNSIKTHGIGILDPLINTSYKYMRSQFQLLSRCLSDEKLKSTLIREICFYRDSIDQLEQMYPMERAEKMTNSLKRYCHKIGGGPSLNIVERLRILIVRIGNMIGLLRMFRSGILETFAPNITFGFKHKESMSDLINNFDKNSIQNNCAKLCDKISSNITGYLTSNNDSIELLTSMFAKEFRGNNKFAHLRDFFILIPTLMIVQIEYISKCRARLSNKKMSLNEDLAVAGSFNEQFIFVEDGFSIGIAYVLTLLNQQFFFNSLNWFDSVFNKIHSEVIKCKNEQKLALKAKDESLARLLALKQSQLNEQLEEFKRLMYSLNSALTFLQANEVCDENIEETYLDDF
uniref:Ribosome biogenesis protein BMS1/TSR1 C-terminal domain-containing protein n=1 Tax=Meloidogyne enterolobii TaxID=390850 RepID=A0A6V7XUS4_MELEN|nr:unnamed protein product [Meloidogyne enterolobii]